MELALILMMPYILALLFWVGCAVLTGVIAAKKGRSGIGWFLLAFIFTPLCLIVVVALNPLKQSEAAGRGGAAASPAMQLAPNRIPQEPSQPAPRLLVTSEGSAARDDKENWDRLVKYDPAIRSAVEELARFGDQATEELRLAYSAVNDPSKLDHIVATITEDFAGRRSSPH